MQKRCFQAFYALDDVALEVRKGDGVVKRLVMIK